MKVFDDMEAVMTWTVTELDDLETGLGFMDQKDYWTWILEFQEEIRGCFDLVDFLNQWAIFVNFLGWKDLKKLVEDFPNFLKDLRDYVDDFLDLKEQFDFVVAVKWELVPKNTPSQLD